MMYNKEKIKESIKMNESILQYESKIWSIADSLRGVSIMDSAVPPAMKPFYLLVILESQMKKESKSIKERLKRDYPNMTEEDIIEELTDDNIVNIYNSQYIQDGISLIDICKNDINFNENFLNYINSYDENNKTLLGISTSEGQSKYMNIMEIINTLKNKGILKSIVSQWASIELENFSDTEISFLEEHIQRKWADDEAVSAGQFYTPEDITSLITNIISYREKDSTEERELSIYDPACGGGNMVFDGEEKLKKMNSHLRIKTYGQEYGDSIYAMAKIKSLRRQESFIAHGNTLTDDKFASKKFDYIMANPPYGSPWKEIKSDIEDDETGRFEAGFPSTGDSQLLFMQHIVSKMKNTGFAVVVSNGSPLFSGDAGSGESNIRKWILDNDYLEALIQLPKNEFFNTGIATYLWVLNKNKSSDKVGKIKLIDASSYGSSMAKNKGDKSKEIKDEQQKEIVEMLFGEVDTADVKVFDKEYFYFNKQSVLLLNSDINDKRVSIPEKKKSIVLDIFEVRDGSEKIEFDSLEDETMKERSVRWKSLIDAAEDLRLIDSDDAEYYFDKEKETIIHGSDELGNGKFKVGVSYKKATAKKAEEIVTKFEIIPNDVKDVEIIPFKEIIDGSVVDVDSDKFLAKWVVSDYQLLDNVVGVQINFNKIFYKYEKLRSVSDIISEIKELEKESLNLDNDLFDLGV